MNRHTGFKFSFEVNATIRNKVNPSVDPADGLTAAQAVHMV